MWKTGFASECTFCLFFRHPDTTINAYLCMFTLSLALIFEVISLHAPNKKGMI